MYLESVYLNNSTQATYTSKYYKEEGLIPTYAYSYNNQHFYGSALFTYVPDEMMGEMPIVQNRVTI